MERVQLLRMTILGWFRVTTMIWSKVTMERMLQEVGGPSLRRERMAVRDRIHRFGVEAALRLIGNEQSGRHRG